eukprot:Gregarina_sp_Poly_1__8155@NODE_471_length_8141_cov_141_032821_g382_i0_p4_GENE_NODE_471_length_8141_cov_141_032821_g382_i0NODE_471_length_8141_cov_141_032821_g382_i0_p4_ORF_typecomplete_len213_score38_28_NODE_471_length_8141_cov_141_032821_g382_i070107648
MGCSTSKSVEVATTSDTQQQCEVKPELCSEEPTTTGESEISKGTPEAETPKGEMAEEQEGVQETPPCSPSPVRGGGDPVVLVSVPRKQPMTLSTTGAGRPETDEEVWEAFERDYAPSRRLDRAESNPVESDCRWSLPPIRAASAGEYPESAVSGEELRQREDLSVLERLRLVLTGNRRTDVSQQPFNPLGSSHTWVSLWGSCQQMSLHDLNG